MKKGRAGTLLRVVAKPEHREAIAQLIFAETSTLGRAHLPRRAPRAGAHLHRGRDAARQGAHQSLGRRQLRARVRGLPPPGRANRRGAQAHHRRSQLRLPETNPDEILPDDSAVLRECRAAHRAHVHHHGRRDHRALQAHAGLRRRDVHRHRRARPEGGARRRGRRQDRRRSSPTRSPPNSARSGRSSTSAWTAPSAPPTRGITRWCSSSSSAAWTTATSTRAATPASTASSTNSTSTKPSPAIPAPIAAASPKPSPKRITSSSSRPSPTSCSSSTKRSPSSSSRRRAATKCSPSCEQGLNDLSISRTTHQMGHPAAGGRQARLLRLVRRADRLHERGGWRRISGPPTCT